MAFDLHVVARRIKRLQRPPGFDFDLQAQVGDRFGREFFCVERVSIANEAGIGLEQLRVGKRDVLLRARLDGKDAHFEHVLAGVFEQRRVFEFADDVLVNPARFVRRHQLGFDRPAVDLHCELFDLRSLRNGEQKCSFDALLVGIVKLLFNGRDCDLVCDPHVSLVSRHLKRAKLVNSRGRDRPGTRPGRRHRWSHSRTPER